MNMTKREFFKRKNRGAVYGIYEDVVNRAFDVSEEYHNNIKMLRNYKSQFRMNTHMYEILERLEKDVTSSFEYCAYLRCQGLKADNYKVTPVIYDVIDMDIYKLAGATGKMRGVFYLIQYMESNELGIRSV